MKDLIAIALGGASGALGRFWVSNLVYHWLGRNFPYGTLAVNLLGSLTMGLLFVLFTERALVGPEWRAFMLVGFLGAFTTFSTFSIETFNLIEGGEIVRALMNILISVTLCVMAAWGGVILGRQL